MSDSWIGRVRVEQDTLTPFFAQGMAALLDRSPAEMTAGVALPRAWHWLYFRTVARQSEVGEDGHERRGTFLPPVPLPRRMWAGGRLRFLRDLQLGDTVTRRSTIEAVTEKEGRSGKLVFVTLRRRIESGGQLAVDEEQHLVYRGGAGGARVQGAEVAPADGDWSATFLPDAATLFRFSALTYNGHRIHYDHVYATEREGYPAVVVHGPLTALLLLDTVERRVGERPDRFEYRAVNPLFVNEQIQLAGRGSREGGVEAWAGAPDGALAMRSWATWEADDQRGGKGVSP